MENEMDLKKKKKKVGRGEMKCHALVNFMLGNFFPSFLIILDLV